MSGDLRLVSSTEDVPEDGLESFAPGRVIRRPGDRHEPVDVGQAFDSVIDAARERRIDLRVAISLLLERRLILRELEGKSLAGVCGRLDALAHETTPTKPLWSANAGYLQSLVLDSEIPAYVTPRAVPVPTRLSERLAAIWPIEAEASESELSSAVEWEVAAVAGGLTMSEWAFGTALDLLKDL